MEHSTDTTAVLTANEPPNGSRLVVQDRNDWKVIWRDDTAANRWYGGNADGQNWFDDEDSDPMVLHEHIKYATAVYALGDKLAGW